MSNPMRQLEARRPAFAQGLTLISLAWVSTVAAVVIAPILPQMSREFSGVPHVALKIPLVATGPSLLVALLAIPFGIWADRVGRRRLLLIALCLYGASGTAPLWLSGLDLIVVSRIVIGLAEAAIMTIGTALISDYFCGRTRERWLAAQTGTAPLTAVVLVFVGGLLGGISWRTPFYVYAFGFFLVPFVLVILWEPYRPMTVNEADADAARDFNWSKPVGAAVLVVLSMIMFMVTVVQFGFLVSERGMSLPQKIGLWSALVTLANPIGAVIFSVTVARTSVKLTIAYVLFAVGFATMSLIPTVPAAIVGGFIANLGGGFFLPTAITWLLSTLPPTLVGRGSGLWTTAVFLGQFLGPLAILGLTLLTGSLSHAILACAVVCSGAAAVALLCSLRRNGVIELKAF